jgi:hypothetical protein
MFLHGFRVYSKFLLRRGKRPELEVREQNAVHAVALARRQVEATERSLVATEAELAALTGG